MHRLQLAAPWRRAEGSHGCCSCRRRGQGRVRRTGHLGVVGRFSMSAASPGSRPFSAATPSAAQMGVRGTNVARKPKACVLPARLRLVVRAELLALLLKLALNRCQAALDL